MDIPARMRQTRMLTPSGESSTGLKCQMGTTSGGGVERGLAFVDVVRAYR
jgi:hypothetical protein